MIESKSYLRKFMMIGAGASALALGIASTAIAQEADPGETDARTLDVVSVTGVRGSLKRAIDIKRNAGSVVDAIAAEDIGKFPDQNLAESLQRITGVSISRARGEGSRVTVRGLGTGFNLTTLNGNTTTSASSDVNGNGGRDFAFDVLPSELVSGIEVYKSPTADLNEGSLGALVNISTAKPFDSPGLQIAASGAAGYSALPDAWDPKLSGLISNTFANDTFGVLLAASFSERQIRQDSFIGNGHSFLSDALTADLGLAAGENPLSLSQVNFGTLLNNRERLGLAGVLQFRPTPSLEIALEAFHSDLEETGNAASLQVQPNQGGTNYQGVVQNGVLVGSSGDSINGNTRLVITNGNDNFVFPGENTFTNFALSGEWDNGGSLTASAKVYTTESESTYVFERYFLNFDTGAFTYDQSNVGDVPTLTLPGVDFSDPATYSIPNFLGVPVLGEEEESGFQIDFDYETSLGAVKSLEFGAQKKVRERFQDRDLFFSGLAGVPLPSGIELIEDSLGGSNLNTGAFPSDFVFGDINQVRDALLPGGIDFLSDFDTFLYTIEEDVTAAYLKANYEFDTQMPISGNVGLRLVNTQQTSSGLSQVLVGVDPSNPDLPLFSDEVQNVSEENNYTDLLWSANLKADLSDDLVMRVSGARVLARPPVSQLAPTLTSINLVNGTLGQGNPALDPFRANQFDATLEWYFNDVGSLSGGVFFKDVETLVVIQGEAEEILPGVNVTVTQPRNIDGGAVYGFEVAYQNQFTNLPGILSGLGVIANYTWVDSDINFENSFVDEGIGLVGSSEHNLNLVGFYEKDGISARLAYNYRTDFLERTVGLAGNPEYVDAFGQLDAQASYDINDNFTAFVEATDITEETLFRYSNNDPLQIRALTNTGARYFFGVRYRY